MSSKPSTLIYDLEVYPNLFLFSSCFSETPTTYHDFEISPRKDNRSNLLQFLFSNSFVMCGFNNLSYDYPVLHHLISTLNKDPHIAGSTLTSQLHTLSQALISNNRTPHLQQYIPQLDLFKLNHFDNKAKMVSLKELQFNFRLPNIQELPFDPLTPLEPSQIPSIISYCHNDVLTTYHLYLHSLPEIALRTSLSSKYNQDFSNFNSTKIGETILLNSLPKTPPKPCPKSLPLSDIILPYIHFKTPAFKAIHSFLLSQVVDPSNLANTFSLIPPHNLIPLKPFYTEDLTKGLQRNLSIDIHNYPLVFGVGGIHYQNQPGIYTSSPTHTILDLDVKSFYPNISIANSFYPSHFGKQFCDTYANIYNLRKTTPKSSPENLAYKLALNGSYGKSNSIYSNLYDPTFTLRITVNGQLLLSMLIEKVLSTPSTSIIQANTDGATFLIPNKYLPRINRITKSFESLTHLQLEDTTYKKMVILNVSNYIAITNDNQIKRKGTIFIHKEHPSELDIHKNFSALVIPKALEAYFVHHTNPLSFLLSHSHTHPEDFFLRSKVRKADTLIARDILSNESHPIQRISRYLVTGSHTKPTKRNPIPIIEGHGLSLIKILSSSSKEISLEANYLCTLYNDLSSTDLSSLHTQIYFPYYLDKIKDTISKVESHL